MEAHVNVFLFGISNSSFGAINSHEEHFFSALYFLCRSKQRITKHSLNKINPNKLATNNPILGKERKETATGLNWMYPHAFKISFLEQLRLYDFYKVLGYQNFKFWNLYQSKRLKSRNFISTWAVHTYFRHPGIFIGDKTISLIETTYFSFQMRVFGLCKCSRFSLEYRFIKSFHLP